MGAIQSMPMEEQFVLLEKPHIQFGPLDFHYGVFFVMWNTSLAEKVNNEQDLFNIMGSMFVFVISA